MVEPGPRIRPRTELFVGILIALVGALTMIVGIAVEARGVWITGVIVLVLGVFAVIGTLLPRRRDGTRIWQTDQGKAI